MLERPPPLEDEGSPLPADSLAAEAERGGDSYRNLPRRLGRYGVAKERAVAMRDYLAGVTPQSPRTQDTASKLHSCGTYLLFRHYLDSDRVRLHAFQSCKQHLLCPLCAIRRGAKLLDAYRKRLAVVMEQQPYLVPWMVTLTVKNGPDLGERFRHLVGAMRTLQDRRRDPRRRATEISKSHGGVWSAEFKRGARSDLWHPHIHGVWMFETDLGPDPAELAKEWHAITGDSFIVEAHPLYGDPADAFLEVFKYALKFSELTLADNWEAAQVLRAKRLVRSFGCFFGVEVPDELTDDEIADEGFRELLYWFVRGAGYRLTAQSPSASAPDAFPGSTGGMGAEHPIKAAERALGTR